MAKINFDATNVPQAQPLEPVPAGWYPVIMTASDLVPTSKGDGVLMNYELTIIDGEYKGRKVFDRLNFENPNQQAAQIGHEFLSALCHSTGVIRLEDTQQLHDKPFQVRVNYEGERTDKVTGQTYDPRNNVRAIKPIDGGKVQTATPATTAKSAAPSGGSTPPWAGGAKTATPATPAKPTPPKPAAPAKPVEDTRQFYVYFDDKNNEMTGKQIADALAGGMPVDTPVALVGTEEWKVAADFAIVPTPTPQPATPPKPASPPKPAATATPSTTTPPWARK